MTGLTPGTEISHRGTPFTEPLLQALHDPTTGGPHLGNCRFDEAQFSGQAGFARAVGWLALAMVTTIVLMMGVGLPNESPKHEAIGVIPPGGGRVTFDIDKDDPRNPTGDRFTTERFEKALNVTLNSVVFRSSGHDLTTTGTYVEMATRFSEPVLLGLAALAIRGRVKR
ncbi:hypothetical protein ACFVJK_44660 [Streptomyces sp. NPDC127172]|uniref:hypothetical protein n=1 Tax=Streptomyces sp. NPDC127172 TaxID=3345382 RepID=UPI00362EA659